MKTEELLLLGALGAGAAYLIAKSGEGGGAGGAQIGLERVIEKVKEVPVPQIVEVPKIIEKEVPKIIEVPKLIEVPVEVPKYVDVPKTTTIKLEAPSLPSKEDIVNEIKKDLPSRSDIETTIKTTVEKTLKGSGIPSKEDVETTVKKTVEDLLGPVNDVLDKAKQEANLRSGRSAKGYFKKIEKPSPEDLGKHIAANIKHAVDQAVDFVKGFTGSFVPWW